MVALAATDWTETVEDRAIWGKKRRNRVKLVLPANTGAFYPSSAGIPLPTTLGMTRNIDYVNLIQPMTPTTVAAGIKNTYLQAYDRENHSIHVYQPKASTADSVTGEVEAPTTWAVSLVFGSAAVVYVEAVGW